MDAFPLDHIFHNTRHESLGRRVTYLTLRPLPSQTLNEMCKNPKRGHPNMGKGYWGYTPSITVGFKVKVFQFCFENGNVMKFLKKRIFIHILPDRKPKAKKTYYPTGTYIPTGTHIPTARKGCDPNLVS